MCSYNRINGTYACEDPGVLLRDLKGTFGFGGWVRSDGHALVDTVAPALTGCDQEMPTTVYFGAQLGAAVAAGQVPEAAVRGMVSVLEWIVSLPSHTLEPPTFPSFTGH